MRIIDADKLYPDCMTKDGKLAISQSQLANAPTVDTSDAKYLEERDADAYETGFLQGHIEGYLKAEKNYARPQGKWVKADNLYDTVVCNKCGGIRRDNRIDHLAFCNKCGADMRGDKNG